MQLAAARTRDVSDYIVAVGGAAGQSAAAVLSAAAGLGSHADALRRTVDDFVRQVQAA